MDLFHDHGLSVWIKRDDLIHPLAGGNKLRKLAHQLTPAHLDGKREVITFGGPASNHLVAVSWFCDRLGVPMQAHIRGEVRDNPCTRYLQQMGVELVSHGRNDFPAIQEADYPHALKIPFGGTHPHAMNGVAEIVIEIRNDLGDVPLQLCTPCGSGGTAAGLAMALGEQDTLRIYPAIKGPDLAAWFSGVMLRLGVNTSAAIHIDAHAAGRGFARQDDQLWSAICDLARTTGIWWDPVYNGKMVIRLLEEIRQGQIPPGSHLVILHTGGLPGALAYRERFHMPPMPFLPEALV